MAIQFGELTTQDPFDGDSYYDEYVLDTNGSTSITINLTSDAIDSYVQIYDENGDLVDFNDDSNGSFNSQITISGLAPRYVVRARAFGEVEGSYTLEAVSNDGIFVDLQPIGSGNAGVTSPLQASLSGQLTATDAAGSNGIYYDDYQLNFSRGQSVTIDLTSTELDTFLYVYENGVEIASNDDVPDSRNSRVTFTPSPGNNYVVRASSYFQQEGSYTLDASSNGVVSFSPVGGQQFGLPVQASLPGQLSNSDVSEEGKFYDDYVLVATDTDPIVIDVTGDFDTYVAIYDVDGRLVGSDDDSGDGLNSRLEFTPEKDASYGVRVTTYGANVTGSYTLQASSTEQVSLDVFRPTAATGGDTGGGDTGGGDTTINANNGNVVLLQAGARVIGNIIQNVNLGGQATFLQNQDLLKIYTDLAGANSSTEFYDYSLGNDDEVLGIGLTERAPGGVRGLDGNDRITGSAGADVVNGNRGLDTLVGGVANDYLRGGQDQDELEGGDGNDIVNGNKGADLVAGGAGDDLVRGGAEDDLLIGGEGSDILIGDKGSDTLQGGGASDTFIFRVDADNLTTDANQADRIMDFDSSDKIGLTAGLDVAVVGYQPFGSGTALTYSGQIIGVVMNASQAQIQGALFSIGINDPIMDAG